MRTAFYGIDIIYIAENMLLVAGIIGHCHFYCHIARGIKSFAIDHVGEQRLPVAVLIKHFDKFGNTAFAVKSFGIGVPGFIFFPEVAQDNGNAFIKIGQFPEAGFQNILIIYCNGKYGVVRPKMGIGPGNIRRADFPYGILRNARMVFLLKYLTLAVYGYMQFGA